MNIAEIIKAQLNLKSKNMQFKQWTKQQLFEFCMLLSCALGCTMPRRDESKLQLCEQAQLLMLQSSLAHLNWIHPQVDQENQLKAYLNAYDIINSKNKGNDYIICDNIAYKPLIFLGEYILTAGIQHIQVQFNNDDKELLHDHNNVMSAYIYTIDDNVPQEKIIKTYCNGITVQFNGFRSQSKVQPYIFNVPQGEYYPINLLQVHVQHFIGARIQLYISQRLNIEQIEQILLKKPMITSKRYLDILKSESDLNERYNIVIINTNVDEQDEDEDVQETNEIINLRSPLTLGQIKVPVKGPNCRHFTESNDLKEVLDQIETHGVTSCPICQQKYKLDQIYIDAFFYYLIRLMKCKDKVEIKDNKIQFQASIDSQNSPTNANEESGW